MRCNYAGCDTLVKRGSTSARDWIKAKRWGEEYHLCSWDHLMQWAGAFGVDRIDDDE